MQNSMMLFTFHVLDQKYLFLGKSGPKNENWQFKLKFVPLDWKYTFWPNLVQEIKIVSLSWNLVTRLIRICRINAPAHLFRFRTASFIQKFHLVLWCYLIVSHQFTPRGVKPVAFFVLYLSKFNHRYYENYLFPSL